MRYKFRGIVITNAMPLFTVIAREAQPVPIFSGTEAPRSSINTLKKTNR